MGSKQVDNYYRKAAMEDMEAEAAEEAAWAARVKELETLILHHDQLYWQEQSPVISDSAYDELVEELWELAPDSPVLNRIPTAAGTVTHEQPMLSLNKAYAIDEVIKWACSVARNEQEIFNIGPKFDGIACEVSPNLIVTRGDGYTGEDITRHAGVIDFDLQTQETERGELVVLKPDLSGLRRSDGSKYKSCRNAAAGILNLKESPAYPQPPIMFMPHSSAIGSCKLEELDEIDFELTMLEEQDQDYPVDGLVISLADREYGESLGETSHHPRHSIAYKIQNPQTTSILIGVTWQVSKTRIAPVALIEPTELDGVTVTRATLHNLQQIKRLGIGIGSQVILERAGSVIPAITAALTPGSAILYPPACPACGAVTDTDGQDVWCTNSECGGTKAKLLESALERLDIEEAGPAVCASLVELGFDSAVKVLGMSEADWRKVAGYGDKSATKMYQQAQQRAAAPIEDFKLLASLNIEGIGISLSKKICDKLSLSELSYAALLELKDVGPARAAAIAEVAESSIELIGLQTQLNVASTKGSLSTPTVCFTGADPTPRDEWIKLAATKGYRFHKGVVKTLALLVTDDLQSNSSKARKARDYGIPMMTYEEFEQHGKEV